MSNPNGQALQSSNAVAKATSPVATNAGTIVQVPDLNVPANRIAGFVERYRKDYFEDHSLEYCLDEILSRGMAEITRQVKTAAKVAENKAFGEVGRRYNMTPAQANALLQEILAKQAADASSAKPKT